MTKTAKLTTEFVGLADAHGIESFVKKDEADGHFLTVVGLRAATNRQRHAVVFRAFLEDTDAEIVNNLIEAGDFVSALTALKLYAAEIFVEDGWLKSFELIPDPDLDPWYSEEESDDHE